MKQINFYPRVRAKINFQKFFDASIALMGLCFIAFFLFLLGWLVYQGFPAISWTFLTASPSWLPERSGIYPALVGTIYLLGGSLLLSGFLGLVAALYLEVYQQKDTFFAEVLESSFYQMASLPSVLTGLFSLSIFVFFLGWNRDLKTGIVALSLLALPLVVVISREAIREVPKSLIEAASALGATKAQIIFWVILPLAFHRMVTGLVIAGARVVGEAAPLIVIGAVTYSSIVPKLPLRSEPPFISLEFLSEPFSSLPLLMYSWLVRSQSSFQELAGGVGLVLIAIHLCLVFGGMLLRKKGIKA